MGEPALLHLKVRHYEVDSYGHVNHANYAHYFETARIEALEAVGLSLAEMQRQGYLIFAADLSIKYRSPAGVGETLEIITYIRDIRVPDRYGSRRSVRREVGVWWPRLRLPGRS